MPTKIDPFQKRLYASISGLAALCVLLAILGFTQGARIRSATIDSQLAATTANQRLLLQLNQTPGTVTAKQITLAPAAPFSVASSGKTIVLQFSQPLRNDTTYKISINMPHKRSFGYRFQTKASTLYYLAATPQGGAIHRMQIHGDDDLIFSGVQIADYLVLKDQLVIVSKDNSGRSQLFTYNMVAKHRADITLPQEGMISALKGAPDGRSFGFMFTPNDYQSNQGGLMTYSFTDRNLHTVAGLGGKPIQTTDWFFAKDSTTILAKAFTGDTLLTAPNQVAVPLGQYADINGFTFDNTGIFIRDKAFADHVLNLRQRSAQATIAQPFGENGYTIDMRALHTQDGYLLRVQSYQGIISNGYIIAYLHGQENRIYHLPSAGGYIDAYNLSPNDQYVAATVRLNGTMESTTHIIDLYTKKEVTTIQGANVIWPYN